MNTLTSAAHRKVLRTLLIVVAIVALIISGLLAYRISSARPDTALAEFFASTAAEDQLMDPLILAGREVVPPVLKEVVRRDMPRRRYAILALGNIGDRAAVEPLEQIALDQAEEEHLRCDALKALALIDETRARALAQRASPAGNACVESAYLVRRSYLAAVVGLHW
jgi:HEAT repeat protein